jgi:beta-glucosidase
VIFPHNIGLGCTRDTALVEKVEKITAMEVGATGLNWTFSPYISVARDERWGRTYESFAETPELVSMMTAACVKGFQGDTLANPGSILACAKSFIADGATTDGIDGGIAEIDEATLRAIHLPSYIEAVKNHVATVMPALSSWNGVKCHESYYLLTTLLKGELGFNGFVISDWNQTSIKGLNAGIDMFMIPGDCSAFYDQVIDAVNSGNISIDRINDAVRRILTIKFTMGLFEKPYARRTLLDSLGSAAHRAVAREAVRKSLVLLKKKDGILPLAKENRHLFIGGDHADNLGYQCGGWTITWQGGSGHITVGTTILEAIRQAAPDLKIIYAENGILNETSVDAALVVIGEVPYAEGVGDTKNLNLPPSEISMIRNLKSAGLPVIVLLISGRPLIIDPIIPYSDAIIAAWLPGTEGDGIPDILFGDYDPCGLLSYSWPRKMQDIPINFNDEIYDPLFDYGYGITDLADSPAGSNPIFYSAALQLNGTHLTVAFNNTMAQAQFSNGQFIINRNGLTDVPVENIKVSEIDSTALILTLANALYKGDEVEISYSGESIFANDGGKLAPFGPEHIYNILDEDFNILSIPGKIEAEDYACMDGATRQITNDLDGGKHVRLLQNGAWLAFYISLAYSGDYDATFRVASPLKGHKIIVKKDSHDLATIDIPATESWKNWTDVTQTIYLESGIYEITLYIADAGFNLNWINFTSSAAIDKHENNHFIYQLQQNYPNPFNGKTIITYHIPITDNVDMSIYNLLGQKIASLVSEKQQAGYHRVEWDAGKLASGIYCYCIKSGEFEQVKKMLLIK